MRRSTGWEYFFSPSFRGEESDPGRGAFPPPSRTGIIEVNKCSDEQMFTSILFNEGKISIHTKFVQRSFFAQFRG